MNRRKFLVITGAVVAAGVYGGRDVTGAAASTSSGKTTTVKGKGKAATKTVAARTGAPSRPAVIAIRYAAAQAGKSYLWGGTGPDEFDCSGLVMMAYQSAGVSIPRTSEYQWDELPHVTSYLPGDLVFFPGDDGSWDSPGHVGLVTGPNTMIQAYAPGTPIGTYPFGTGNALKGTGPGTVIGYARPVAGT